MFCCVDQGGGDDKYPPPEFPDYPPPTTVDVPAVADDAVVASVPAAGQPAALDFTGKVSGVSGRSNTLIHYLHS